MLILTCSARNNTFEVLFISNDCSRNAKTDIFLSRNKRTNFVAKSRKKNEKWKRC